MLQPFAGEVNHAEFAPARRACGARLYWSRASPLCTRQRDPPEWTSRADTRRIARVRGAMRQSKCCSYCSSAGSNP